MSHQVICSYLVILALGGVVFFLGEAANFPVKAQQVVPGNITEADVERLRDNTNDAREAIHNDDTEEALGSLGFANSTTLEIIDRQQPSGGPVMDQLNSLLADINEGLNAVRNNDSALALNEIGGAESQLFRLSTTVLPTGTAEEDGTPEEPEVPAAGTPEQDLESLQDSINEARGAILDNDISGALEILNGTQGEFSQPATGTAEEDGTPEEPEVPAAGTPEQDLESLQDSINEARGAILDNDISGALEILNGSQGAFSQ